VVQDFVPISPPRRISPETGHLVVWPELEKFRPPRDTKQDSKKAEGDGTSTPKPLKGATDIGTFLFVFQCGACVCVCAFAYHDIKNLYVVLSSLYQITVTEFACQTRLP
jgi:hypothetical protein